MTKGTPSMGKKGRGSSHIICRRCGSHSLRKKTSECSHCGFGKSSKIRNPTWNKKFVNKKRKK